MKRRQLIAFFSLLALLLVLSIYLIFADPPELAITLPTSSPTAEPIASPSSQPTAPPSPVASPSALLYPVVKVVDGDTIKVSINEAIETIRLVGIDAPESVDPRRPVECMGKEASMYLTVLLTGQSVQLIVDPTQADRDRYGRLLRFVLLADGTDVGLELISQGFAQEALYSTQPHQFRSLYLEAQKKAEASNRGLWDEQICL
jgi:micrococcal nuclease